MYCSARTENGDSGMPVALARSRDGQSYEFNTAIGETPGADTKRLIALAQLLKLLIRRRAVSTRYILCTFINMTHFFLLLTGFVRVS